MPNSALLDSLFVSFHVFLTSERTKKRLPYNYIGSFRTAQSAPSSSTAAIFLNSGFQAWAAYFIVFPGAAHSHGQTALRRQFAALDDLSEHERAAFAQRVNKVQPHATVADLFLSMESAASRTPKRLRKYTLYRQTKCGELLTKTTYKVGTGDHPLQTSDSLHGGSQPGAQVFSGADVDELNLFNEYFRSAIRRNDAGSCKTAAISINFPPYRDNNCFMTIEVLPNKVERLALELFNAHLETNEEMRELVLPGGLKAAPLRLQGASPKAVLNVFGPQTAAALEAAPYRKVEIEEEGRDSATRCVTMSECHDSSKGAILTLTLGRIGASQIYERLFKSKLNSG